MGVRNPFSAWQNHLWGIFGPAACRMCWVLLPCELGVSTLPSVMALWSRCHHTGCAWSCGVACACSWGAQGRGIPCVCLEKASPALAEEDPCKSYVFVTDLPLHMELQRNLDQEGALEISSPTPSSKQVWLGQVTHSLVQKESWTKNEIP